jgi:NAD(P)-dependent dehydrogenase (short-subunit alcohol dehydrogenase family)
VSDEAAVDRAFAETVSTLGGVDACFVNAGVSGRGAAASFAEMTTQEWHRVLAVNLDGAFFTLRAAARHMTARGAGGSWVTASLAALEGSPLSATTRPARAMLSVMRPPVGLARHQIRVNAIVPG